MAEDLKIIIGADSSQLAAELQKAENELRKLQASLKKMSDVEAIEKTQRSIRYLQESIRDLNIESGKAGKALGGELNKGANQASQSLLNMGRVVQDAPYGFMGIANNINPLLESFQRLKATTGSTGGALKELGASFMSGAGLGVAISIATSLLVVFGDKLFKTSKSATDFSDANKKLADGLISARESANASGVALQSYVDIAKNGQLPLSQRNEALREANKILGEHGEKLTLANIGTERATQLVQLYTTALIAQNVAAKYNDRVAQLIVDKQDKVNEIKDQQLKINSAIATQNANADKLIAARGQRDEALAMQALQNSENVSVATDKRIELEKELTIIQGEITKQMGNATSATMQMTQAFGEMGYKVKDNNKALKEYEKWLKGYEKLQKWFKANKLSKEEMYWGTEIDIQVPKFQFNTEELNQSMRQGLIKAIKAMKLPTDLLNEIGGKIGLENLSLEGLDKFFNKFNDLFKKGAEKAQADQGQILADLLSGTIFALAEGLGAAITNGAGSLKSVFSSLFSMFGDAAIQLGKNAILFSKGFLAIQAALKAGKPILGIGAGIALIAIGSLIKAGAAKLTPRFATGTSFTPGGMALVGERGPELVNIPRGGQVVPAGRTSQIMGGMGAVEVFGMLRGQDIYFSNKKYSQTYNRTT